MGRPGLKAERRRNFRQIKLNEPTNIFHSKFGIPFDVITEFIEILSRDMILSAMENTGNSRKEFLNCTKFIAFLIHVKFHINAKYIIQPLVSQGYFFG